MRRVNETVLSLFFAPLNLNSLFSVNLLSSRVENCGDSLMLFVQEPTESFLQSMSMRWDSDCSKWTCLEIRFGNCNELETSSFEFSVARNGSFKSSIAGNLVDAGTKHFSMNTLTWWSLTLPREAGFMPCNRS